MRKYCILKEPVDEIKKVMIYEMKDGVFVFLYNTDEDAACFADYWFATLKEAEEECSESYGIGQDYTSIGGYIMEQYIADAIENMENEEQAFFDITDKATEKIIK